jgi:hypothetical protein
MKLNRSDLDDLKSRGARVIGEKEPEKSGNRPLVVIEPPRREDMDVVFQAMSDVSHTSDQMKTAVEMIVAYLESRSRSTAPVAYRFTMVRNRFGRLTEVIAKPFVDISSE